MTVYEKGLITVLGVSFISLLVALPLALRKVPRNIVYGFRTRTTLSSDDIWYEANAHFGIRFAIASIASAVTMFALYVSQGLSPVAYMNASIAILVGPPLIATITTARFIRTLNRT